MVHAALPLRSLRKPCIEQQTIGPCCHALHFVSTAAAAARDFVPDVDGFVHESFSGSSEFNQRVAALSRTLLSCPKDAYRSYSEVEEDWNEGVEKRLGVCGAGKHDEDKLVRK